MTTSDPESRPPDGPGSVRRERRHLLVLLAGLAVAVVVVDVLTKQLALARLSPGTEVPVIDGLLSLRMVLNPGAAFSFATGMTWVFTIIAVAVVVVIVRVARRLGSRAWAVALGLLLGGAVGNLLDRLFRPPGVARGHVVDFIDYGGIFVGNVADIAIVAAAGLVVILAIRGVGVDGTREHDARRAGGSRGEGLPDA